MDRKKRTCGKAGATVGTSMSQVDHSLTPVSPSTFLILLSSGIAEA